MSNLRVALVSEGPTDAIVIEAVLKAILPIPFVLTLLQPEETRPKLGTGWGGVLRWCLEFASRPSDALENDPTLPGFDLFVIHVDADVAGSKYADVSSEIATLATERKWPALPCDLPCPPPGETVNELCQRVLAWAGLQQIGCKSVLCLPSKAIESWLVAALFQDGHALLNDLECSLNLEAGLANLEKSERVKKGTRRYRELQDKITENWSLVCKRCSQADRFSHDVLKVIRPLILFSVFS